MADKELKKPGLVTKFINWFGKSIIYGAFGLIIIRLIDYVMQKLHAPLKDLLVNWGITAGLSEKLLIGAGAVVWVMILGNVIMYFRKAKK